MLRIQDVLTLIDTLAINKSQGVVVTYFKGLKELQMKQKNTGPKCTTCHLQSYPDMRSLEGCQHDSNTECGFWRFRSVT